MRFGSTFAGAARVPIRINATSTRGFYLYASDSAQPNKALLYLGASNYRRWPSIAAYYDDNWHLFVLNIAGAAQADIASASLYIDGVLQTSDNTNSGGAPEAWTTLLLGSGAGSAGVPCYLDEVRYYTGRNLGVDEIRYLYVNPIGLRGTMISAYDIKTDAVEATHIKADNVLAKHVAAEQLVAEHFAMSGSATITWDPVPAGCELWDLQSPDCTSHLGRRPKLGHRSMVYVPGLVYDEVGTEYANPAVKFTGVAVAGFGSPTTNLVASPEYLAPPSWTRVSCSSGYSSDLPSLGGLLFAYITSTADGGYVYQDLSFTSDGVKGIRMLLLKDTEETDFQIQLRDTDAAADRLLILLNWSTKAWTETTGSVLKANWYSDDIVEVFLATTSVTHTNNNRLAIYPSAAGQGTVRVTAVQAEDKPYPTLYTPTDRIPLAKVTYTYAVPATGTAEMWVCPLHTYDVATDRYYLVLGAEFLVATPSISILYQASSDKWVAQIYWSAGNHRQALSTSAFVSNATLMTWQHLKITWDIPNQTITLAVNKVAQTGSASAGDVTAIPLVNMLTIGGSEETSPDYSADALICDVNIWPNVEDTSTTHYDNAVPYYDEDEIANESLSFRVGKGGARLSGGAELNFIDEIGRQVLVGPGSGLEARDRKGLVLHDIPDAPLPDVYPMGHLYLFRTDSSFYTIEHEDPVTTGSWVTVTASAAGNSYINGVRLKISLGGTGSSTEATAKVLLRPTGSGWSGDIDDLTTDFGFKITRASEATVISNLGVVDIPVDANNQFDYFVVLSPAATSAIYIQQLGYWR